MSTDIANRSTSAFPLSVGTSLAFESIFDGGGSPIDPDRVIPQHIELKDYDEFWINVETLYRNLVHSLQKGDIENAQPKDIAEALYQEMEIIMSLMQTEGYALAKPVFYVVDYSTYLTLMVRTVATIREDKTELQKRYTKLKFDTMDYLFKMTGQDQRLDENALIKHFRGELSPASIISAAPRKTIRPRAIILSHLAYDLESRENFNTLDLIESHTGVLKKYNQFYTKYTNGKTLTTIPFLKGLLPVFGDSEFFHPLSIKIRNTVIDLSKAQRWTPITTRTKVLHDLQYLKDQFLAVNIKTFF